ncbi:MAG: hypothetical protein MUF23_15620 [Pirellula sp.]|nr:hypothetical protein [Pirellula sp.]
MPEKIESTEAELSNLHQRMSQADYFKSAPDELASDQKRLRELENSLEQCYRRYEELDQRSASA